MALTNKLTNIANAIREKTGNSDLLTLEEMASAISSIESGGSGGDTSIEDGLITRTLTSYSNSRITEIGKGAFYGFDKLQSVSFPNVTKLDNACFRYCNLTNLNGAFPNLVDFGDTYAFANCTGLTEITELDFPKLEKMYGHDFRECTNLEIFRIRTLTDCGMAIGRNFYNCQKLKFVDLGHVPKMGNNMFHSNAPITTLILRNTNGVVPLGSATNADYLGGAMKSGGTGGAKVYVPQALIESYKVATNWSTVLSYGTMEFVPIEGSEYE